jgi:chromosome segregation ATPase
MSVDSEIRKIIAERDEARQTIRELREQLGRAECLMGAAAHGKAASERRLVAVCSERDEWRSQLEKARDSEDKYRLAWSDINGRLQRLEGELAQARKDTERIKDLTQR